MKQLRYIRNLVRAWWCGDAYYEPASDGDPANFRWERNRHVALSGWRARLLHIALFCFRVHWRFLFHYVMGTGTPITLAQGWLKNHFSERERAVGEMDVREPCTCSVDVSDLYMSVGKCLLIKGIDAERSRYVTILFDRYEFYAWCGCHTHFKNCGCPDSERHWGDIPIVPVRWLGNALCGWLTKHTSFDLWSDTISPHWFRRTFANMIRKMRDAGISDKFFSYFGKPFYTTGVLTGKTWKEETIAHVRFRNAFEHEFGISPILY